jgi:hypothetical protein
MLRRLKSYSETLDELHSSKFVSSISQNKIKNHENSNQI